MYFKRTLIGLLLTLISVSISAQIRQDTTKRIDSALIVINGNEYPNITVSKLDSIVNPNEISSINILKGIAAITLYGEKGKNGVIQIVTKNKLSAKIEIGLPLQEHLLTDSINTQDTAAHIFEKVEIEASFPGGDQAYRKFLERNLNATVASDNGAPEGTYTVLAQFVVDKKGYVSNVRALTNHGYGMEKEVIRIITKSPNWIPGIIDGQAVNCYRKLPVTFVVMR